MKLVTRARFRVQIQIYHSDLQQNAAGHLICWICARKPLKEDVVLAASVRGELLRGSGLGGVSRIGRRRETDKLADMTMG